MTKAQAGQKGGQAKAAARAKREAELNGSEDDLSFSSIVKKARINAPGSPSSSKGASKDASKGDSKSSKSLSTSSTIAPSPELKSALRNHVMKYLPRNTTSTELMLPITLVNSSGDATSIAFTINPLQEQKNFWQLVATKLSKSIPKSSDDDFFKTYPDATALETGLAAGGFLFPTLLDQTQALRMKPLGSNYLPKTGLKTYLASLAEKVQSMISELDAVGQKRFPTTTDSFTIAQFTSTAASPTITMKEHVDHLAAHTSILNATAEHIRRELVTYGTVVHALAMQAQQDRGLAQALFERFGQMIAKSQNVTIQMLRITHDPNIPLGAEENASESKDASESKGASESKDASEDKGASKEPLEPVCPKCKTELPGNIRVRTLPEVLVTHLTDKHRCLCKTCCPQYAAKLRRELSEQVKKEWYQSLSEEAEKEYKIKFTKDNEEELSKRAMDQAVKELAPGQLARLTEDIRAEEAERAWDEIQTLRQVKRPGRGNKVTPST
ncbi:MAG: hypothetical protein Q9188_005640 [Gyalolechia gomerana]